MKLHQWIYLLLCVTFVACGGNTATENTENETTTTEETPESAASAYTLTPFAPSAEFADAEMKSMAYKDGKFSFEIGGETYKLGEQTSDAPQKMCANSGKGQHIHLIVDDMPYAAKYVADFEHEVEDGEHYMLAFLSRSYHESIKTASAFKAEKVAVEKGSFTTSEPVSEPMLFYSRPKGTYVGKANTEKVMLDFYLANAMLGDDYKVKVEINGQQEFVVDKWQPYYLEGLPMGDNKVKLTLLDKDGNAAAVPLNPVERVFTLKEDPIEKEG